MRYVYLTMGMIALVLGMIGIFVPILPTTPFFLLSACCFSRSSKKLDEWFQNTTMYQKHIYSYVEQKSMSKLTKIKLLSMITFLMLIGIYCSPMTAKIIIGIVLIFHYYYFIFRVKTIEKIIRSIL